MALQDLVTVSISLETTGVSQQGFGTPLFIGAHRWFNERVKTYTSLTAVGQDIPQDSIEYKAAQKLFSQVPTVPRIKIGRREAVAVLTPATPTTGTVYSFTLTDGDGNDVAVSYTALALDDAEDVATGLKGVIDGDVAVAANVSATVTGATTTGKLELDVVAATDSFYITNVSDTLTVAFTTSETAAEVMAEITSIDDDFYFVTAHDHTEAFVLAMAADVEARTKVYFVSNGDAAAIGTLGDPPTDILGKLYDGSYFRTVSLFHQDADTEFPECEFVGKGAPFDPGTITWANKQVGGVAVSRDPSTGKKLSQTQLDNLAARNANMITTVGGVDIVREGKVVGGEWLDVIQSRDLLVARITEALQTKLISVGKVPYTDSGINSLRNVVETVLDRYVSTNVRPNILQENNPYETDFPPAVDMSFTDKANRTYTASFKAYLAGAIQIVAIQGVLTYDAA